MINRKKITLIIISCVSIHLAAYRYNLFSRIRTYIFQFEAIAVNIFNFCDFNP